MWKVLRVLTCYLLNSNTEFFKKMKRVFGPTKFDKVNRPSKKSSLYPDSPALILRLILRFWLNSVLRVQNFTNHFLFGKHRTLSTSYKAIVFILFIVIKAICELQKLQVKTGLNIQTTIAFLSISALTNKKFNRKPVYHLTFLHVQALQKRT